jgi:hypothetical protein
MRRTATRIIHAKCRRLPHALGTIEYKSRGLEGFVPTTTQIASGLCEIRAYVNKLTGSGSSITDHLVKYNVDGHLVAKTATDVFAQAGIVMKAMKNTTFTGVTKSTQESLRWLSLPPRTHHELQRTPVHRQRW